jgi:hypothetical protein
MRREGRIDALCKERIEGPEQAKSVLIHEQTLAWLSIHVVF